MVIPNCSQLATKIRRLKDKSYTDREIALELDMPLSRVTYIRSKYGIGGRYALYSQAMRPVRDAA